MNTLKQASFLRFMTPQPVMAMSHADQVGLWEGLKNQDAQQVERCLSSTPFPSSDMKFIPVRVLVGFAAAPIQFRVRRVLGDDVGGSDEGSSRDNDGDGDGNSDVTLGDLLNSWLPDYPLFRGRNYRDVMNTMVRCLYRLRHSSVFTSCM